MSRRREQSRWGWNDPTALYRSISPRKRHSGRVEWIGGVRRLLSDEYFRWIPSNASFAIWFNAAQISTLATISLPRRFYDSFDNDDWQMVDTLISSREHSRVDLTIEGEKKNNACLIESFLSSKSAVMICFDWHLSEWPSLFTRPLHHACERDNVYCAEILINKNANIEVRRRSVSLSLALVFYWKSRPMTVSICVLCTARHSTVVWIPRVSWLIAVLTSWPPMKRNPFHSLMRVATPISTFWECSSRYSISTSNARRSSRPSISKAIRFFISLLPQRVCRSLICCSSKKPIPKPSVTTDRRRSISAPRMIRWKSWRNWLDSMPTSTRWTKKTKQFYTRRLPTTKNTFSNTFSPKR